MDYCLKNEMLRLRLEREQIIAIEDRAGCGLIALYQILVEGKLGLCEMAFIYTVCSACGRDEKAWEKRILEAGLWAANEGLIRVFEQLLQGEAAKEIRGREGSFPQA